MTWCRACSDNACVEVARDNEYVYIRSSWGRDQVTATREEWDQFLDGAKAGAFDDLPVFDEEWPITSADTVAAPPQPG